MPLSVETMFEGLAPREMPIHDAVTLMAEKALPDVVTHAARNGLMWPGWAGDRFERHFEYEMPLDAERSLFADFAILKAGERDGFDRGLLLEIKSDREPESASGWYRQIRGYEKASGMRCMLVVAHDLRPESLEYLTRVGVVVCDLRELPDRTKQTP